MTAFDVDAFKAELEDRHDRQRSRDGARRPHWADGVEVVFHLPDGDRRVPWAEVHEEIPATRSERGAS
jgi:hypothetical protein